MNARASRRAFIVSAATLAWTPAWGQTGRPRRALLVGNRNYDASVGGPLANPERDALRIGAALRRGGLEPNRITTLINATKDDMAAAIAQYAADLAADGDDAIGFTYYAGHGASYDGRNFLIPVNAQGDDAWSASYDVNEALAGLARAQRAMHIVAIDACRTPFASAPTAAAPQAPIVTAGMRGFTAVRRATRPQRALISYAAWEGQGALDGQANETNSPYAAALSSYLGVSGLSIPDIFRGVHADVTRRTANAQEPMNIDALSPNDATLDIHGVASTFRPCQASRSFALVCANGGYSPYPLARVQNDASRMEESLIANDFAVTRLRDASSDDLFAGVEQIARQLRGASEAGLGVVYFAGFAANVQGSNYLLPAGQLPANNDVVRQTALPLERILRELSTANPRGIVVILDCGRRFEGVDPRGIQLRLTDSVGNVPVVIAYSSQPGQLATEDEVGSVFARHLTEEISRPERRQLLETLEAVSRGVMVATDGRQRPWFQAALAADSILYFRDGRGVVQSER